MKQFTDALDKCIDSNNWYGALFIALSLPDICGKFAFPRLTSSRRYSKWFDVNLLDKYSSRVGIKAEVHVFLSGDDCYALRCAYLHEGIDDITGQKAQKVLERFNFVEPEKGCIVHLNQFNNILQLQVSVFCSDISEAVTEWFHALNKTEQDKISATLAAIQLSGIPSVFGSFSS